MNLPPFRANGRQWTWNFAFFLLVCLPISLVGCTPYHFGAASLFPPGIRTVYVPAIRNETFRHDLGPQLAEAITMEIERRTPYKVVGHAGADTQLQCVVTSESKQVLTETQGDDPRGLDLVLTVRTAWTDRLGNTLMQNSVIPTTGGVIGVGSQSRFVPEAGQSTGTASVRLVDDIAQQIVSQMESRW
ncbi:MAG: LptE family protein [Planctomycetota bacterium]